MRARFFFSLVFMLLAMRLFASPPPSPVETPTCVIPHLTFIQSFQNVPNVVRVPFKLVGRLVVVQAAVGSVQGNFVVDSGADKLVLNQQYFEGGIAVSGTVAIGMAGTIGGVKMKYVDSLRLEQLSWVNLKADLVDLRTIEENKRTSIIGLIGYEVLKEYEIFFDYGIKQLILVRLDENGDPLEALPYGEAPIDSLQAHLKGHLLCLDATVEGHKMELGLDSGAELNLLDREVDRKILDYFKILKRVKLIGAGGKEVEVLAGKMIRVRLGTVRCSPMNTLLTSMDELNSLYGTDLKGILGYEFFGTRRMAINYKKQKLYFFAWQRP